VLQCGRHAIADRWTPTVRAIGVECTHAAWHPNLKGRRASRQLAIEILKGVQVLITKGQQDIQHSVVDEIHEWTDQQLKDYIRTGKAPLGPAGHA
jgi:hypothetical protein